MDRIGPSAVPRGAAAFIMMGILAVIATIAVGPTAEAVTSTPPGAAAWVDSPGGGGCNANVLPANDDGSTSAVALPFTLNFFGSGFDVLYVNNNGNVTFEQRMSTYTPFTIDANVPPIIAPFLADVDTRGTGSGVVTYGTIDFAGRQAFCVEWEQVGYYSGHVDKLNDVQLLLVNRADRAAGDFDIYFNYRTILWETGDASGGSNGFGGTSAAAGYSAGTGEAGSFFQLPCSLMNGACLNSNSSTGLAVTSTNSATMGRHIFPIESGGFVHSGAVAGTVRDGSGSPVVGGWVDICPEGGRCRSTLTGSDGGYRVGNLPDGSYTGSVFPPGDLSPASAPTSVTDGGETTLNFTVTGPTPPPPGTTLNDSGPGEIPVAIVGRPTTLEMAVVEGCDEAPTFQVLDNGVAAEFVQNGQRVTVGTLVLTGGIWTAEFVVDFVGPAEVVVAATPACGGEFSFSIYIDPSGYVRDTAGNPIIGARVVLFRADDAAGPFSEVPDGSVIMSPSNRNNPDVTDATGHFGWDVSAGFYYVRANADGCTNPTDSSLAYVDSAVYAIPPPVTDIDLRLDCGTTTPPPTCDGLVATIVGSVPTGETINGTSGRDVIVGNPGRDTIKGLGGNDVICAGGANDVVYGGPGADRLFGEDGNDTLVGNGGADHIEGGNGHNMLLGGGGNDVLIGGPLWDRIGGGANDDTMTGNGGFDLCDGNSGTDSADATCEDPRNVP